MFTFLKSVFTLGSRLMLLAIGYASYNSNYWIMISALCVHALLCVGRQLCIFFEDETFLNLAIATLFMIQAIQTFPYGRFPFNESNKAAYSLSKLSALTVIVINFFGLFYSLMKAPSLREGKGACKSTFCFSSDAIAHFSICIILAIRIYQYHYGMVDTGAFNFCGCASPRRKNVAGVIAESTTTRIPSASHKTD